ncbi:hypothetical protein V6N00_13725 [Tersicoccus sp. MR15.9]|uniref:hypothetical protein n=1 Tax=Tersicoccus mangrovi TaxID=3121635 RepID=UPI002FE6BDE3
MSQPATVCTQAECGRVVAARGLCAAHYRRRALGLPMDTPIRHLTTPAEVEAALPRIRDLRASGATLPQIADRTGLTYRAVRRIVAQHGVPSPPPVIRHGTTSGWMNHGCPCPACTTAKAQYKRTQNQRRIARANITAEHGTVLAYEQGCRCEDCSAATAAASRERNARTRARAVAHRARWTEKDKGIATRADLTIEQKAAELGRLLGGGQLAPPTPTLRLYRLTPASEGRVSAHMGTNQPARRGPEHQEHPMSITPVAVDIDGAIASFEDGTFTGDPVIVVAAIEAVELGSRFRLGSIDVTAGADTELGVAAALAATNPGRAFFTEISEETGQLIYAGGHHSLDEDPTEDDDDALEGDEA